MTTTGSLHHVEIWVPDLQRAIASWGWLLELVDSLTEEPFEHGWSLLFSDLQPHAGGPNHYAAYPENPGRGTGSSLSFPRSRTLTVSGRVVRAGRRKSSQDCVETQGVDAVAADRLWSGLHVVRPLVFDEDLTVGHRLDRLTIFDGAFPIGQRIFSVGRAGYAHTVEATKKSGNRSKDQAGSGARHISSGYRRDWCDNPGKCLRHVFQSLQLLYAVVEYGVGAEVRNGRRRLHRQVSFISQLFIAGHVLLDCDAHPRKHHHSKWNRLHFLR